MLYQNLKSFQKHLSSAAPQNLCRHYLVAIADDFERLKALDAILHFIPHSATRLTCADTPLKECFDAMQSMSLFGENVVVLDEIEKLSKKELESLSSQIKTASGYLLLGARSKVTVLANRVETEGVVLDLLEEKPWDKEKRLADTLEERAKKAGKTLSSNVALLLLERLGVDAALLESEIDKLICYVGARDIISQSDVLAISPLSKTSTLWQQAEEMIWEGKELSSLDSTSFHAIIPALRSQLHLGLSLATFIEEKRPSEEWGRFLPKLWPKTLEKRSSQAARLGVSYFRKGLEKLFEIELLSRSNSTQYAALLDLFRAYVR